MSDLVNYGYKLGEVYIGAFSSALKKSLREDIALQVAFGATLVYANTNKPQEPIRIILESKKDSEEKPKKWKDDNKDE